MSAQPSGGGLQKALRGTYFGNIPEEQRKRISPGKPDLPINHAHVLPVQVRPDLIGDLLQITHAFAAPLAELFAFVRQGHPPCSFIPQKQLALLRSPFWQYGLLAFVSGAALSTLSSDSNEQKAAKANLAKQEESNENEVDALTFMQTVIMSFVRGMTNGEQTLPINDLFANLPVLFFHECGRHVGGVPRSS